MVVDELVSLFRTANFFQGVIVKVVLTKTIGEKSASKLVTKKADMAPIEI